MSTSTESKTPSEIARETFRILFEERDLSDPYRIWTDDSIDHFLAAGLSIRGAQPLAPGAYTVRVLVRDANGVNGGFTWRFSVGEPEPPVAPAPAQKPAASPQPNP
jgi:hypothetical protein